LSDLLEKLNPEQRAAVVHGEGPLMVLAGAGTGKTRVLTHRIATLVERGVPPREILAVTFTNKAAGEMRERLDHLLGLSGGGMWIGTFHATCARILRTYPEEVGLTREFTIFDDDDQRKVVAQLLKQLNVSERVTPRSILSRIDRAKNAGQNPAEREARDVIDDVVRRLYPAYQARLARENAVDFNDILLKVLDLLAHRDVGPRLRGRFGHVLVDEFQDTNVVQYRLVRELAQATRNLCVVGDDDQSIYAWRGAEPRNLLDFDRDWPDAKVVKLERNYRSTSVILAAANAIICKNVDRHAKALWTEKQGGEPILLETTSDERAEAEFIAQAMNGLRQKEGREFGDLAILYRTHAQSRALEESLRARRVPYRIVGGVSFFQRREIKDVLEYVRLAQNPMADSAFERVVNTPTRGLGDGTVDKLRGFARASGLPLLEGARRTAGLAPRLEAQQRPVAPVAPTPAPGSSFALAFAELADKVAPPPDEGVPPPPLSPAIKRKLAAFIEMIDAFRVLVEARAPVAGVLTEIVERSEYATWLETEDEVDGPDRKRNVGELIAAAGAYDAEAGVEGTVAGFLERVSLTAGTDAKDGRGEAVTLMTVHAAKGLEFPVVFLSGLEESVFPSLREGDLDGEIEEERRLAYVAFTRAMERVIITHARTRRSYDGIRANPASRFIGELPAEVLAVRQRPAPPPRPQQSWSQRQRAALADDGMDQRGSDGDEPVYYVDDAGGEDRAFPRGAQVRHRIFGVGLIEDGSGRGPDRRLVVRFPGHGVKTIVARFVERVSS
jgi:DNA helicase-2/ATP-dependent DNA helicase PcrA